VEVPIDLQRVPIERPAILDSFVLPLPPPRTPTAGELDELAARIVTAKRPMLWIGSGARRAGAAVHKLLDLGFTVLNSANGKGTVSEEHPMSLGALHGNGMPKIQQFYQTVDLMLAVGTRLRGQETGDFVVKLPSSIVQIDVDPLANGRTYANTYFVCGDAGTTLEALLPRIEGRMKIDPAYRDDFAVLKRAARDDFLATLGVYGTFPEQLRPVMPKDAIWVRDVTQSNTTWGNRIFPLYSPHQSVSRLAPASARACRSASVQQRRQTDEKPS
jgi:acetolactate synthase-1/2/3 large subunit